MNEIARREAASLNPFGEKSMGPTFENTPATIVAEGQRAMKEVEGAMVLAKKFPRDNIEAMDRILKACTRPTLAEEATYAYPRGGTQITGPSIRLAEAIAQAWGNLQFGIRELSQHDGESTVESYCWDLESNSRSSKVFQVPHVRYTKKDGRKSLTDPRDIYETVANQGARRLRACILSTIPGDVLDSALKQAETTLANNVDLSPDGIKKTIAAFKKFNVTKAMLEKRLGHHLDAMIQAEAIQLRKIYTSIKDGMSTPGDWFEVAPQKTSGPLVKSKSAKLLETLKTKAAEQPTLDDLALWEADTANGRESLTKEHQIELAEHLMDVRQKLDGV